MGSGDTNLKVAKPRKQLIDRLIVKQMGTNSFNSWSWEMLESISPKAELYSPATARVRGNTKMGYERVGCKVRAKP